MSSPLELEAAGRAAAGDDARLTRPTRGATYAGRSSPPTRALPHPPRRLLAPVPVTERERCELRVGALAALAVVGVLALIGVFDGDDGGRGPEVSPAVGQEDSGRINDIFERASPDGRAGLSGSAQVKTTPSPRYKSA